MRVIGGIYRGRHLRTTGGLAVRPTSDRLRETLFNILRPLTPGSSFLDLCAGSGAVGIEALSRGADSATFIENSRRACRVIEDNLRSLLITDEATVINRDVVTALKHLAEEERRFDLLFFDPPYASDLYEKVMNFNGLGHLMDEGGVIVVEHRAKTPLRLQYGPIRLYRQVKQGESSLGFYSTDRNADTDP